MKGFHMTMSIHSTMTMLWMFWYSKVALAQGDLPLMELKAEIFPDPTMNPSLSPDHGFGWSVDYSGDTLIAGSYRAGSYDWQTNSYVSGGGSARVFVRSNPSSNVEWIQQGPPLVIDDPDYTGEYVGYRVAIDGDTALVTATRGERGAARLVVFARSGDTWTQQAILVPGGDDPDDGLVPRVALEGDVAVFGKPFPVDSVGSGNAHGKVFVLKRAGTSWAGAVSVYTIVASDKKDGDYFGSDVAISAGRILVGADEREVWDTASNSEALVQKGKAYMFAFDGTAWIEEQIFVPDGIVSYDRLHFGAYVALDGNTALIGNNAQVEGDCKRPIPVFSFTQDAGGSWDTTVLMSSDYMGGHVCSFGRGVTVKGNSAVVEMNGPHLLMLENWTMKQWLYPQGHYGYVDINKEGNFLVLGTDVLFSGVNRGIDYTTQEGSVHVYDNFSVRPNGPENMVYFTSSYYPGTISITYEVGHGQAVDGELLQVNCLDAIPDIAFFKSEGAGMKNLTHDYLNLYFTYDTSLYSIGDSIIFNADTWEINFCHTAFLVGSSSMESEMALALDVELKPAGVVGGSFGDPHIVTFDELKYDCQAAGIFTTLTSLQDPTFEIQEKFTSVQSSSCSQASVSTGVVVKDGIKPIVQISTPGHGKTSLNSINGCPIDFFVNGVESALEVTNELGSNVLVKLPQNDWGSQIKIIHTDSFMTVDVRVEYSSTFGCFMMVKIYIPESFRVDETLLGLLGTPNGDVTDDWMSKPLDGTSTVIAPPVSDYERLFSAAYEYCVNNWCQDSSKSLFTLRSDESFMEIDKCAASYVDAIEVAVADLVTDPSSNQELHDICTYTNDKDIQQVLLDLTCVVDGLCGDANDARNALSDRVQVATQRDQMMYYSNYPTLDHTSTQSSTWDLKAQIRAVNPDFLPDNGFGWSLDISGDTLIAASYNSAEYDWETDTYGPGAGSARVFKYTSQSNQPSWEQQGDPIIVRDLADTSAEYVGYRVAIDGNVALISTTKGVGGVARLFVFELKESAWEQIAMLHVDDDYLDDGRIPRVALEGDFAVYGRGHGGSGKVFVYHKSGSDWSNPEVQELVASDGALGDYFGADVAISGDNLIVGASQREMSESSNEFKRGKAYAFVNNDLGVWEEVDILYHPWNGWNHFQFGSVVAIDGNTVMIGHDTNWAHICVFQHYNEGWRFLHNIVARADSWDHWSFGKSIDISGDLALVGGESGEVTLLERSRFGSWEIIDVLRSIGWNYSSRLGRNLAISPNFALVGTDNGEFVEGSVQVFDSTSPKYIGPDSIRLRNHQIYNTPEIIYLNTWFFVGYGRETEIQVLKKDCESPIPDALFNTSIHEWRDSLSETGIVYSLFIDTEEVESSSIYNKEDWEIEFCVLVELTESSVKLGTVFEIFHPGTDTPPGLEKIYFMGSRTSGNGISINYEVGRDRAHEGILLQKDCETPINDTVITQYHDTYSMNSTLDKSYFRYELDPETIRESTIFNETLSIIEVCHLVQLTNTTNATDRQILNIRVPRRGTVAGLFGDPHILTFDGLQYDCQAAGEFTTLTSLEDPSFKIQERFTAIQPRDAGTCAQASVSTGVAFVDKGKPVIQISTPRSGRTSLNSVNECPIDFFIDGTSYRLQANLTSFSSISVTSESNNKIRIKHTDTFVALDVTVHKSDYFGCHIMVQVALPGSFRSGETLLGLLGTPNGDKDDDWMTPQGDVLNPPTSNLESFFSTAYDYCRQNWCAHNPADSLFTYGSGESFDDIYKCQVDFTVEIENSYNAIIAEQDSNALYEICNGNVACIVDGLCGDVNDAQAALESEQVIVATKEQVEALVFLSDEVEVQEVTPVSPGTTTTTTSTSTTATSTTTTTTGTTTTTSTTAVSPATTTATTTTTATSAVSNLLDGYFSKSVHGLGFTTEYYINILISGTSCKLGDTMSDFSSNQVGAVETALEIGFCDKNAFPLGSCSVQVKQLSCKNNRRALKYNLHRMRKLGTETDKNVLILQFVVAVSGQCVNYDCSDGVESMKAVGNVIERYAADHLTALVTALKTADSSLFAFITIDGLNIGYRELIAPLLEKYSDWYPKWDTNEKTCSNDGQYELYMKMSNFVKDSLEECCNAYYSWAFDECMVLGGADQSNANNLEYFYVDYYSNSCKQSCFQSDATDSKNCGGIAHNWMQTFKSAEDCCSTKLFWVDQDECIAASTNSNIKEEDKGSKYWYVDWEMYKCVRDCMKGTNSNCGGLSGNWDDMFDSPRACCNTMLPWLEYSECIADD